MKKIILGLILISSINLFAKEVNFKDCSINKIDNFTQLFICGKEQYLVEYTNSSKDTSNKVTLISSGTAIVIKAK